MIASFPRGMGQWSMTLLWLELAWRRGDETELVTRDCVLIEYLEANLVAFKQSMVK